MRIKAWLLIIGLILVGCYQGSCIQTKKYYRTLSEEERAQIAEMTAAKLLEAEEQKANEE